MEDQLIETWAIHNRINIYFLDAVADDALGHRYRPKAGLSTTFSPTFTMSG